MTTTKKETRPYSYYEFGMEKTIQITYELVFKDGILETVFNTAHGSWGHTVEKDSEVWNYFNLKYNS